MLNYQQQNHTSTVPVANTFATSRVRESALVYYSSSRSDFQIFSNLPLELDFCWLWVMPKNFSFKQDEIKALLEAFDPLRCVIWSLATGTSFSSLSQRPNDLKRAFGRWKGLKNNVFKKNDFLLEQRKYYSDLSILSYAEVAEAESFFISGTFGCNSTLAFVKDVKEDFPEFDILANLYLWNKKQGPIRTLEKSWLHLEESQSKVAGYLNGLLSKGVVASLTTSDVDTNKGLIFLSLEREVLERAAVRLQTNQQFRAASHSDFYKWIDVMGLCFQLLLF